MTEKSHDHKGVQERVSLGEKAPESLRRSGTSLARPGHFSAVPHVAASAKQKQSSGPRAVRATIKPSSQSGRKD
jgi:hypothetical protein